MDYLVHNALQILQSTLATVDTTNLVKKRIYVDSTHKLNVDALNGLEKFDINKYEHIYLIGAGKAAASMAEALENILDHKITDGIVITKYGHSENLKYSKCFEAGHPIPDKNSMRYSAEIVDMASNANENDLIIFVLSGGASALFVQPVDGISLFEIQHMTHLLIEQGASIKEINAVRTKLSKIKGGGLSKLAHPSEIVTLIISDVLGDSMEAIGSGPTVQKDYSQKIIAEIIDKYKLKNHLSPNMVNQLTKKSFNNKTAKKVSNLIIGNLNIAIEAAAKKAIELGFTTHIASDVFQNDIQQVARRIVRLGSAKSSNCSKPVCVIFGGEPTVNVQGKGLGGRNQELALRMLIESKAHALESFLFLSSGTDGTDGPTDMTGGLSIDFEDFNGRNSSVIDDYLSNNDSYHYLAQFGGHIFTGPTHTNVNDIQILLINS